MELKTSCFNFFKTYVSVVGDNIPQYHPHRNANLGIETFIVVLSVAEKTIQVEAGCELLRL